MNAASPPPSSDLGGCRTLCLMAVEAEYGAALRTRIAPCFIGVGPIEAALATTLALTAARAAGTSPELVLSLGSAGSRTLEQTGVYQASSVSWRDMDASPLGFERGCTPYLDLPAVLPLPIAVPGLRSARLSTGADVVSGADHDAIDADMVDMETFAVLRVCLHFGIPLIGLRGISDGAVELRRHEDWSDCLPIVDAHLADAVDVLADALANGLLTR